MTETSETRDVCSLDYILPIVRKYSVLASIKNDKERERSSIVQPRVTNDESHWISSEIISCSPWNWTKLRN